jgi:hypothetical protein
VAASYSPGFGRTMRALLLLTLMLASRQATTTARAAGAGCAWVSRLGRVWSMPNIAASATGVSCAASPTPNAGPACVNDACALICSLGFADCNGIFADGCETNLQNDRRELQRLRRALPWNL